ncbi:putative bifunctional UDP-N-acetylglucosamine transferase and deubiquitinase ALG13 isoform X7 [Coregonus clupeaformis]|uniref:putative bifunctional UDP-N-acetylglucosamine transferase and deubiquitinase ALG13 isoform X7 n=1 Tax=Coregonus clupeaformis TaxID=59861 RepID=UPI001E1C27B7|nr:putative bifunctional UDP-N-acetylglucosamine transferase and deubiquitinase ALG13 isoform X7 [Coregonus clupeaformis]
MQKALKKYFVNMDEYLASIGLYRKMMARDASCLFRAVSEQLYYSQNFQQKIRKDCVTFMRANRCNFEPFVEGSFEKYLERLEDPTETAGQVEIKALSLLYRRCFLIYRYPGKPPTEITEKEYVEKILLCCSNNGHYDIVYPRNYPIDAALCQALLYELLYTQVLGVEEVELQGALEGFRGGGRRYRNSLSVCSEDAGYDTPEDRGQTQRDDWELNGHSHTEDKARSGAEETPDGPTKLSLPYKVLKALDSEMYRNVEFDVWHDSRKEMQKTDYMVFAGRQYFLGDKCQVRLDPKGKYYNAFIQEVGTHPSAVTVFIEELGEKHLVSLTNLKPVNPVPAWNITPSRKGPSYSRPEQYPGEMDSEVRGRRRFFKKPRGKEMLMVSYNRSQPGLPPRFRPGPGGIPPGHAPGMHDPPPPPGTLPYEHYHPHPPTRPPRGYGPPRSSARFLNRHHLIGPEAAYYPHPGKRCYQSFDNYSFRRQMHAINKECQFSYVPEAGEEARDMEGTITFYEIEEGDETTFPPLPGQAVANPMVPATPTYWVQRGASPIPMSGKQAMTSSEEDADERSNGGDQGEYSEEYIYTAQDPGFQSPSMYAAAESTANLTIEEGGSRAGSPQEGVATYSYSQQLVVKSAVITSSQAVSTAPAAIFTSNSSSSASSSQTPPAPMAPPSSHPQGAPMPPHAMGRPVLSMQSPPSSPWFVNEMGEAVSAAPPPPYSYDPNGNDLPRDCKVIQYYFNLGVQWYQQSYWHSMVQVYQQPGAEQQFRSYPGASPPSDHTVPQPYPEPGRMGPDGQGDIPANGTPLVMDPPSAGAPGTVFYPLVQDQCSQPPLHTYESYVPMLSATYHYLSPWNSGPAQPRVLASYCPSSNHPVNYVTAPTHPGHFIPPSM